MMINNHHALKHPVKPGAAGLPMPGFEMAILDEDLNVQPANTPGVLAVNIAALADVHVHRLLESRNAELRGGWYITATR